MSVTALGEADLFFYAPGVRTERARPTEKILRKIKKSVSLKSISMKNQCD